MIRSEEIWKQVVKILRDHQQPGKELEYVKEILEGVREDLPQFPAIVIEPLSETEVEHTVPRFKKIIFSIAITCWIEVYKKDYQIIGEKLDKGILDITRDVRNILEKYPDLNKTCLKFSFPSIVYTAEFYPYRSAEITVAIEYIVEATQR